MAINEKLIDAIKNKKDLQHIQELVEQGADINFVYQEAPGIYPRSMLNLAAESGDFELTIWLKAQGAKPFIYEFFGKTHKFFIDHEAHFKLSGARFGSPLMRSACNSGSIKLVKWLLDNGVDISEVDLSDAAGSGNLELVRWLVEDKNVPIDDYAIAEAIPNRAMLDWLFAHGATVSSDGLDMHMAIWEEDLDLMKLLYDKGAKLAPHTLRSVGRSCNQELKQWMTDKLGNISEIISTKHGEYYHYDPSYVDGVYEASSSILEAKTNFYLMWSIKVALNGPEAGYVAGKNMWISMPKLTLENCSTLSSGEKYVPIQNRRANLH